MKTPNQTPKSTKKAKNAVDTIATPVKPITPKSPKTPKEKKTVLAVEKSPKEVILSGNGTKSTGGNYGVPRHGFQRKGSWGFGGNRGRAFQASRSVDNKGIFCKFAEVINGDVAKVLMKLAAGATSISFGRSAVFRFDSEENANEFGKKAAAMEVSGISPCVVSRAYVALSLEKKWMQKRSLPDEAKTVPSPKKQKAETKEAEKVEVEEEDDDDDDEEEEGEEGKEEDDDDDDDNDDDDE